MHKLLGCEAITWQRHNHNCNGVTPDLFVSGTGMYQLMPLAPAGIALSADLSRTNPFFKELRGLIDRWCDWRCLKPLGAILPAYNSFNCMMESCLGLLKALKELSLYYGELRFEDREAIENLRRSLERAIQDR